jgi:uncharacterized oligopeptide transporter (OPT) family protein
MANSGVVSIEPSLLLVGFGGIIGIRAGVSLFVGAIIAWGGIAPWLLRQGIVEPSDGGGASLFGPLVEWLLWPGVSLMMTATLTIFIVRAVGVIQAGTGKVSPRREHPWVRGSAIGLSLAAIFAVCMQVLLFDIRLIMALLSIPFAILLASVAARVVGETGIPPIGAIGKVSQLTTGVIAPGELTANLISANVAGGAAGQSADLLNDLKVGHLVGTPPRSQVVAQCFGVLTGSVVGSIVYLRLIPDPASMLVTEEWPAPAVATWKAVAEALSNGFGAIPASALWAVAAGGVVGIAGAWLQHRRAPWWLPNLPAFGLAMVIPASISITMFFGSLVGKLLERYQPNLAQRFLLAAASGLIAGESLTGVMRALLGIVG